MVNQAVGESVHLPDVRVVSHADGFLLAVAVG